MYKVRQKYIYKETEKFGRGPYKIR